MKDWSYGLLPHIRKYKEAETINPIFLDEFHIPNGKSLEIEIKGQGKIIQISFISELLSTLLSVGIDDEHFSKINNGYCLQKICDTRGIGNIQIELREDHTYRYTCLIPIIFNKNIKINLSNESSESIDIKNLHIYYLIPKEIK